MGRKQRKLKKATAKTAAMSATLQQCKEKYEKDKLSQDPDVVPSGSKKKHLTEDSTSNESGTESSATDSSTDSDNDAMPDLEDCDGSGADTNAGDFTIPQSLLNPSKHSRGEKKARRILSKLDLRQIEGVTRVSMRKSKDVLLYIDKPDVFRYVNSDTYLFFGEVRVDDLSARAQVEAAEKFTSKDNNESILPSDKNHKENGSDNEEGEGNLFDVDGLDDKDIELVMMQANTSRAKAIRALREHENDVVNAIMALTML